MKRNHSKRRPTGELIKNEKGRIIGCMFSSEPKSGEQRPFLHIAVTPTDSSDYAMEEAAEQLHGWLTKHGHKDSELSVQWVLP